MCMPRSRIRWGRCSLSHLRDWCALVASVHRLVLPHCTEITEYVKRTRSGGTSRQRQARSQRSHFGMSAPRAPRIIRDALGQDIKTLRTNLASGSFQSARIRVRCTHSVLSVQCSTTSRITSAYLRDRNTPNMEFACPGNKHAYVYSPGGGTTNVTSTVCPGDASVEYAMSLSFEPSGTYPVSPAP